MIGYLEGTVQACLADGVVVMTAGGVGYQVRMPGLVLARVSQDLGSAVKLFVSTVVREGDISLFGFDGPEGKALFELLTTVSGIGPKLALAMLSAMSPGELAGAIVAQDVALLSSVPGIGKKTAARVCLELTEKLRQRPWAPGGSRSGESIAGMPGGRQAELLSALTNLGFPEKDVLVVLRRLPAGPESLADQLKQALALLGRT